MINFDSSGRAMVVFQLHSHPRQQMSIDLNTYIILLKTTNTEAEFRAALMSSAELSITTTEEFKGRTKAVQVGGD
jgi:hypothetical protein